MWIHRLTRTPRIIRPAYWEHVRKGPTEGRPAGPVTGLAGAVEPNATPHFGRKLAFGGVLGKFGHGDGRTEAKMRPSNTNKAFISDIQSRNAGGLLEIPFNKFGVWNNLGTQKKDC